MSPAARKFAADKPADKDEKASPAHAAPDTAENAADEQAQVPDRSQPWQEAHDELDRSQSWQEAHDELRDDVSDVREGFGKLLKMLDPVLDAVYGTGVRPAFPAEEDESDEESEGGKKK